MDGKKKVRIFIALIICFLLGAAAVLVGIHLDWDNFAIISALVSAGGVSAIIFTSALKGKIDISEDEEEDEEDRS